MNEQQTSKAVLDLLAALLADRGFVDGLTVEAARRDGSWHDPKSFLTLLTEDGHLTTAQATRVEALLLEQQRGDAEWVANEVLRNGLLDEADVASARKGWDGQELSSTFREHLVAAGLLTSHQASGVPLAPGPSPAEARPAADSRWGALVARLRGVAGDRAEWARGRWARLSRRGRAVVVVICTVALFFVGRSACEAPPPIAPECNMNGMGAGTCVFANGGTRTRRACGMVVATCEGTSMGARLSANFCSGEVHAGDSVSVNFTVPEFDRITPNRGDWRDSCGFLWLPIDD